MSDRSAAEIKSSLDCHRSGCQCRGNELTHCPGPSHSNGDRNPSLGVTEKDGKVLVCCYGTCSQDDVISALQERDLWPRAERKAPDTSKPPTRFPATYDYCNPDGTLNFQVVRKETLTVGEWKKSFLQRRPRRPDEPGNEKWVYRKGNTDLLYRLPELLASDPAEIVFEVEGEKDADRLTSLGLVATTRAEGAGKWTDANSQWLKGRRVCILGDNDVPGEKDAELRRASIRKVATAVILELNDLPEHGDVSDWLDAGGTAEYLITLAEGALSTVEVPETPAPDPIPFEPSGEPTAMPLFPTEILPPTMVRLIDASARALNVPPEFVAVPLLVLAGTAIGNAWCIEVKKGWRESPSLYAAVVGDPGSGKTPALKIAQKPLIAIQDMLADEYAKQKKQYDDALSIWEGANKKDRGAKPDAPKFEHVWTTDPTTEVLAEMLVGTKGLAYTRDELAGWVASMDAYRNGKGADRQHFLSMWAGAAIKIDRKSRPDPIRAGSPCLSIVGGIQPDKLPALVDKGDTEDGFLDRMLWAYPDLGRSRWTNAGVEESLEAAVADLFMRLHHMEAFKLQSGKLVPNIAQLDAQALPAWETWFNHRDDELNEDGFPSSLKGTWAKLPSQLARVALILHVTWAVDAHQPVSHSIPIETAAAAMDLMEYFKEHARYSLASVRTSRSTLEGRIVSILTTKGPQKTRDLFKAIGGRIKGDRLNGSLERLVEDGRVELRLGETGDKGGRPAKVWAIPETSDPISFAPRSEGRAWKS